MSALATMPAQTDIGAAVIGHLDEQLASGRRLLDAVLRQGAATRRQDVDTVVGCLSEIQGEMERRAKLEQDRTQLLVLAAGRLARAPHDVTLDALASLMTTFEAAGARERSAELRGLLAEIQREHVVNRALMKQELAFLDHLVRLVGAGDDTGYQAHGNVATAPVQTHRVLDMRA